MTGEPELRMASEPDHDDDSRPLENPATAFAADQVDAGSTGVIEEEQKPHHLLRSNDGENINHNIANTRVLHYLDTGHSC